MKGSPPHMASKPVAMVVGLALSGAGLCADTSGVYKCTAGDGAVTYSTSPCDGAKREFLSKEKLERKMMTVEFPKPPATVETAAPAAAPPVPAARATGDALPVDPKIRTLPIGRKPAK